MQPQPLKEGDTILASDFMLARRGEINAATWARWTEKERERFRESGRSRAMDWQPVDATYVGTRAGSGRIAASAFGRLMPNETDQPRRGDAPQS